METAEERHFLKGVSSHFFRRDCNGIRVRVRGGNGERKAINVDCAG